MERKEFLIGVAGAAAIAAVMYAWVWLLFIITRAV